MFIFTFIPTHRILLLRLCDLPALPGILCGVRIILLDKFPAPESCLNRVSGDKQHSVERSTWGRILHTDA